MLIAHGSCLAALITYVSGHAAMMFPMSRNTHINHECATCANGPSVCGSAVVVGSEIKGQWMADTPLTEKLVSKYTTPMTRLIAGGKLETAFYFSAPHYGHFVVELCQQPKAKITEECFVRLKRDPTDDRYGAYHAKTPEILFLPDNKCTEGLTNKTPMRARWLIPDGSLSEHAIIRWVWQSGNSCDSSPYNHFNSEPSSVQSWAKTLHGRECTSAISQIGMSCGSNCPTLECEGEQFRNCGDVQIVLGDKSTVVAMDDHSTEPPPGEIEQPPHGGGEGNENETENGGGSNEVGTGNEGGGNENEGGEDDSGFRTLMLCGWLPIATVFLNQ